MIYPVSFGNKSILKTEFDRGAIPLKRDITGHKLKRGESSVDHTIPKSKGGSSGLYNYSLMNPIANNKRSNKPIKQFIDLEALIEYIRVFVCYLFVVCLLICLLFVCYPLDKTSNCLRL